MRRMELVAGGDCAGAACQSTMCMRETPASRTWKMGSRAGDIICEITEWMMELAGTVLR